MTHDERIAALLFSSVYPLYIQKIEKKGRSKAELISLIEWLTGFTEKDIAELVEQKVNFQVFFERATLHPNAHLISGNICGYRIEEIQNPLTKKIRYLDKIVDELAKGKALDKIMRK